MAVNRIRDPHGIWYSVQLVSAKQIKEARKLLNITLFWLTRMILYDCRYVFRKIYKNKININAIVLINENKSNGKQPIKDD